MCVCIRCIICLFTHFFKNSEKSALQTFSCKSSSAVDLREYLPVVVCPAFDLCEVMCCSVLQCVAVCCSVLQCVAVCCSVLQCVAVQSDSDLCDMTRSMSYV